MTKYGFDDNYIGRIRITGSSLETRMLQRPHGLRRHEWYRFAGRVCEILNMPEETIDTSDMPEVGEDWFKKARLVMPNKMGKGN